MLRITVKVVPRSASRKCVLDTSGMLKCSVKSPPEDGAANAELVKMLAKLLGLTQRDIAIVAGAASRTKIIELNTHLTQKEVFAQLGLEVQDALF